MVSKCCCEATTEDAKIIFGPLQVGVSTEGGAEASVHATRKLAKEFGEDPGKIMFKWIFRMRSTWWTGLRCSRKFMRSFLVLYCCSHPAHLFFGSIVLQSMAGVQQGDPLGPLLFSLVLHPLASKVQTEFPHLDLCVFYLDDGVTGELF